MAAVLTAIHVVAALFMILVVLLQAGKGSGMGSAFGGASQASFGGGGGLTLLGKITAAVAVIFMLTSMSLAYLSSHKESLVDAYVPPAPAPAAVEALDAFDAPPAPIEQLPVMPLDDAPAQELPVGDAPADEAPAQDELPAE